jgi:ligand-binding SRPBCC domain-containing protein
MTDHLLERRFWVRCPRPEVFEFLADPRNLPLVSPPPTRLVWLAPPPRLLSAGAVLDFSVRMLGVPVRWRVMIREFDRPHRFIDVQLRGPFTRWEHRHRFVEGTEPRDERCGTWVEDRLVYQMPLGWLGDVAHALAARRRITALFDYRERRLRELLTRS